jgi:hypothetical protein
MREVKVKLYEYDELSEEAQEKVIEKYSDINTNYDWWDTTYEDTKEIGKLMGIDITNIYFSGFSSQGDGACFEGSYQYAKNSVKALKEYAPQDKELHRIAEGLYKLQKEHFYRLQATVKQSGRSYHKYSTDIRIEDAQGYRIELKMTVENELSTLLRDFMEWIYRMLEKEYEYQTAEAQIEETIRANDFQFLKDGTTANCLNK